MDDMGSEGPLQWLDNASRTASFWGRASLIYASYKVTQVRANLALSLISWSEEQVEAKIWEPQHEWAGKQMYLIAVDLRGFYLKVPPSCHEGLLSLISLAILHIFNAQVDGKPNIVVTDRGSIGMNGL